MRGTRQRKRRTNLKPRISNTTLRLHSYTDLVTDAVSGRLIEKRQAVLQRGRYVSANYSDGTRDAPTGDPRDDG